MGRVSQAQAQQNRQKIVETAARLFKERGVPAVSVADVMAEVGLTHGGFYKQFASKEALVAEAVGQSFVAAAALLAGFGDSTDPAVRRAYLDYYLSPTHRDEAGAGCPAAGFGGDLAHHAGTGAALPAYTEGVESYARWLGSNGEEDLVTLSTMVGAIVLARATAGTEVSDRILAAAHAATSPAAAPPGDVSAA